MIDSTYNGWSNYETWNVSLWIQNDEGLYNIARRCSDYKSFVQIISEIITETLDGVSFTDHQLDIDELDEMIDELWITKGGKINFFSPYFFAIIVTCH